VDEELYYELENLRGRLEWLEDHLSDSPSYAEYNDLKAVVEDLKERVGILEGRLDKIETRLWKVERLLMARVRA